MELFGYVCSPLCNANAEAKGMHIPVFKGKKSVVESRHWRKVGAVSGALGLVIAGLLGFWFWYAWIGSVPKSIFSVHFEEPALSGQSILCGTNQVVFLHGQTLARYELKTQKQAWSCQLLDSNQIALEVSDMLKKMQEMKDRLNMRNPEAAEFFHIPSRAEMTKDVEEAEAAALALHVQGENIWVASSHNLARYDWDNGKRVKELPLTFGSASLVSRGDELLTLGVRGTGQYQVSHVSLNNGDSRVETFGPASVELAANSAQKGRAVPDAARAATNGLPMGARQDPRKPMNPAKVAREAQNLSAPAKIALPALLASALHEQRVAAALSDSKPRNPAEEDLAPADPSSIIPSDLGYLQFSTRLVESRFEERNAMKAPSNKSALDDANLNVSQSVELANEMANDAQRERGADTVVEDNSRYEVNVRRLDSNPLWEWHGNVIGPPAFHPLKTVSVLAGAKQVIVLDKSNKQLWQAALDYRMQDPDDRIGVQTGSYGEGPCVEAGETLYVFDSAVLTAFELRTGNVRWRLPAVGIVGLFFDDKGMLYVNSTTASPESLKYSRQIDFSKKTSAVVLKVNPATGKTLWTSYEGGFISYVSGKFLYMYDAYQADEDPVHRRVETGLEKPSHIAIRRLDPGTGHMLWEHYQKRAPLDVKFDRNSILLVFKKEVQVLRFFSF